MSAISIALVLAALLLALLIALTLLLLPQARITLRPETRQVQIITDVTADPFLTGPAAASVPARSLQAGQPWVAEGSATANRADDQRRIRAQALQALNTEADDLLAAGLASDEWIVPGSSRVVVTDESFESGGTGVRRLILQTDLTGLAIDRQDVERLVTRRMAAITPGVFTFLPGSLEMSLDPIPGRMDTFRVTARGRVRAEIDARWLQDVLRGQTNAEAFRILGALPLEDAPRIDMLPIWRAALFDRLPLLARRLHIELLP